MTKISIIVAMSKNFVIGKNNSMPWHISEDLKRFKRLTVGNTIIMGRKTFESIGKVLPDRRNIILTRNKDLMINGAEVVSSIEEALSISKYDKNIFIIGGEQIYRLAFPHCSYLYLTYINKEMIGDAFFPKFDKSKWLEVSRKEALSSNNISFSFIDYKKIA